MESEPEKRRRPSEAAVKKGAGEAEVPEILSVRFQISPEEYKKNLKGTHVLTLDEAKNI